MKKATRPQVIAGNWKMHKTLQEAKQFIHAFIPCIADHGQPIYLAVPYLAIPAAVSIAQGTLLRIGAQNMHDAKSGAYTGEISAEMLRAAGASFVLLGHSERRHLFGEEDDFINRKVLHALSSGLQPIICIGETRQERKEQRTEEVLVKQLTGSLATVSAEQLARSIIAYEPVWAIGTGDTASAEEAERSHALIRAQIASRWGQEAAQAVVLLYGGSVKPDNARNLLMQENIDGLLVGGASLTVDSFVQIVHDASLQ